MKGLMIIKKMISNTKNISFSDLVYCIKLFGFKLDRIKGSHHIFIHSEIKELINIQNVKGKAKPYQIKQFLKIIEKYNLKVGDKL